VYYDLLGQDPLYPSFYQLRVLVGITRMVRVGYSCTRPGLYLYLLILQDLSNDYLLIALVMDLVAQTLRMSGPTHGGPPYSFSLSPLDVVPMVPNLVSSP
jgi:hypothetical protein